MKWNRTWATLKATPAYLQDLFYRNVPEAESDFDRSTPQVKKTVVAAAPVVAVEVASTDLEAASEPVVARRKKLKQLRHILRQSVCLITCSNVKKKSNRRSNSYWCKMKLMMLS